jgi:hypothetical protein
MANFFSEWKEHKRLIWSCILGVGIVFGLIGVAYVLTLVIPSLIYMFVFFAFIWIPLAFGIGALVAWPVSGSGQPFVTVPTVGILICLVIVCFHY